MAKVELLEDAMRARVATSTETVAKQFHPSIRPILARRGTEPPEFLGSSILVEVEQRRFVVTAAHIVDNLETHHLYVAGSVGTQPEQIRGQVNMTARPLAGRNSDKTDIAYWELNSDTVRKLGDVEFLTPARMSHNRTVTKNRQYLAMGYPISRNKKNVDNPSKALKPSLSKYTAVLSDDPKVARERGVSGERHLFLEYNKYSETADGTKQNTFKPVGLSGGALVDLGNFASFEAYVEARPPIGYLAGMIIEKSTRTQVLMAVKIQVVLRALRAAKAST